MSGYPWYELVDAEDPIEQGDLIRNCPIVIPQGKSVKELQELPPKATIYNVVVMTQTCDIKWCKVQHVVLCPYFDLNELAKVNPFFRDDDGKNELRRGNVTAFHMLNKCEIGSLEHDLLAVEFRKVFNLNIDILKDVAVNNGERLRLLPPFREHLSQAFARFFMRVALPEDIPKIVTEE